MRINISSGAEWEDVVGYSRAVKVGGLIVVSGTTGIDKNGEVVGKDDIYRQTKQCILNIEEALKKAGASLENVVRTRTFVTDIDQWEAFGKAHQEFFGKVKPAATLVEVSKLIHPDLLVEIEVDAVLEE
ncbi:RidA family protein [Gracilimonas tropica]|uniref:RidA family protein n=1 Tax=Gracilimonas tropica TaxID=454600 RepID=UPI00035DB21C|nr:RidA family protein [Gracilimonas tropica]